MRCLYLTRSCASSPNKSFLTLSNHLRFGLPLLLFPGTYSQHYMSAKISSHPLLCSVHFLPAARAGPNGIDIEVSWHHMVSVSNFQSIDWIISLYLDIDTYFGIWILYADFQIYTIVLTYRIWTYNASIEYRTQFWYRQASKKLSYRPSSTRSPLQPHQQPKTLAN